MIELIPFLPKDLTKKFRVSVHRSGRIGFTADAADRLKLSAHKSATISKNGADSADTNLYLILHPDKDTGAFKVNTNGTYYSINIKLILDALHIKYDNGKAWFEMEEIEPINGQKVFKLENKTPPVDPILDSMVKK